ncbi:MAG: class I SAM-dependent methyltransferase [Candidatus Rokubacteria bacterium]|nr:class I SAM-dependent methyltransferase [Candidatus Rokubacteria bacterium]
MWGQARILDDLAWYPNEQVVRFVAKYLRKRTGVDAWRVQYPARPILDLGCGTGRHVKMFAEQGFEVHGVDISFVSLRLGVTWMTSLGLPARFVAASTGHLPYATHSFDVVVAHGVLDHMTTADACRTVEEVERVLRPGGLFYVDLISKRDSGFGRGVEVEPDTFIVPEGIEAGAVQRFFDEASVAALLDGKFMIADLVYQEWYPVIGRGMSALDKESPEGVTVARFHVVARRGGRAMHGDGCGSW